MILRVLNIQSFPFLRHSDAADLPGGRYFPFLRPCTVWRLVFISLVMTLTGCQSLVLEGSSAGAGIAGAAVAQKVTDSAAVTTGIGVGVQAATRSAVQYVQREMHGYTQEVIATAAGKLKEGEVAKWKSVHSIPMEPDEQGRVTVSRLISQGMLECKEIVYSVDSMEESVARNEYYVASICKDNTRWVWATAEPAVSRWGALQ